MPKKGKTDAKSIMIQELSEEVTAQQLFLEEEKKTRKVLL